MLKNKKGFTLVELLAVIAVLAILLIVLLPNVIDLFNNAQRNSFTTEVQQVYRTAQQRFLLDRTQYGSIEYARNGSTACKSGVNKLDLQGSSNIDYYVELNPNGEVVKIALSNDTFSYSSSTAISIEDIKNTGVHDAGTTEYTADVKVITDNCK